MGGLRSGSDGKREAGRDFAIVQALLATVHQDRTG